MADNKILQFHHQFKNWKLSIMRISKPKGFKDGQVKDYLHDDRNFLNCLTKYEPSTTIVV